MRVLDPFAGVGTTLIEALKQGDDAIGYEINPYAALACRTKIRAADYDVSILEAMIARFDDYGEEESWLNGRPKSKRPRGFRSRVPFYSPDIELQVLACLEFIEEQTTDWVKDLFQVAFGSVMVSFSNYSYEPSLARASAPGKPNIEYAMFSPSSGVSCWRFATTS